MIWKKFIVDYFTFTRKERVGILALTSVLLVISLLPLLVNNKGNSGYTEADTAWIAAVKKLEITETSAKDKGISRYRYNENDTNRQYNPAATTPTPRSLFDFDPNTIDQAGWEKLGLNNKTIHIIQNYRSKGGRFYKAEDLKRIYSIRQEQYERLAPYIKIESKYKQDNTTTYPKENEIKHLSLHAVDINTADTSAFIALPGIGSKLAARIVSFRDRLGGFYSIGQVGETYGLTDSTFRKIKQYLVLEEKNIKKLNINTATRDEMKIHPYIRWNLANSIVEYRNQHGNFNSLPDLKKLSAITDSVYSKIAPYLEL